MPEEAREPETLVDLFSVRVRERPNEVAVECSGIELSYAELDRRSARVSRFLEENYTEVEEPVGILMDRGCDAVASVLGVVKAGCAYVPLDIRSPDERLRLIIEESGIRLVLVDRESRAEYLRGVCGRTVRAIVHGEIPRASGTGVASGARGRRLVSPAQLAYVIYTSGSTGVPKGVEITHGDLATFATDPCWSGVDGRVLLHSPLNFDASVYEMWVPLLRGGCVVVAPPSASDAAALRRIIADDNVTSTFVTTSLFNVVVDEYPDAFAGDCQVWMGGEAASAATVQRAVRACGPRSVVNVYGPTEATIFSTYHVVPDPVGDSVPIGTPMDQVRAYVVDEELVPVSGGDPGELCLGGVGVARAYRARPGLTAERFVPDPFAGDGTRMYRTGDLVRTGRDGLLEFVGRRDDQVKIRGVRIELGEIENHLARRADIARVAVVTREDERGEKVLVAYVVPHEACVRVGHGSEEPVVDDESARWGRRLLTELRRHLPEHMVPSDCVVLDRLPLTPNGKLDRQALPAPVRTGGSGAPRNADESWLCGLFAEILALPVVGVDDDFFELGGHSLLAARVIARVEEAYGIRLLISDLFDAPTVAGLAPRLSAPPKTATHTRRSLVAGVRPETVPLSYDQHRLWLLNQMEDSEAHPAQHIAVLFRLRSLPDVDALRTAITDVMRRHEVLRTVYPSADGAPRQLILEADQCDVGLSVADIPGEKRDEVITAAARHPFDLRRDPPLRARIFRTEDQVVLLLVLHHISADGWSLAPLSRDLGEAYAARRAGSEPGFSPLPVQYRDYAAWQRDLLDAGGDPDGTLTEQVSYWTNRLAGIPDELRLPTDRPRPAVATHHGDLVRFRLPAEVHRNLEELARRHRTTLFVVLHAGLAALLHRLSGEEDIVVGSPVAGRSESVLDDLIGFFVNTVVLRTRVSEDPDFHELVRRVRQEWDSTHANQDVPFDLLVEKVNPTRSPSRHPIFQVALGLLNTPGSVIDPDGMSGNWEFADTRAANFDLAFTLIPRPSVDGHHRGLDGVLEYATDLFDRATARLLVDRFLVLLREAVAKPGDPIRSLDLLVDGRERAALVSGSAAEGDSDTVVDRFRDRVARRPDDSAVIAGDAVLTYRELDDRSDRLAHRLLAQGSGPERCVALLSDRGIEAVTALLGILKSGAAYVPLDPRFPASRMRDMLAECEVGVVLVDSEERRAFVSGLGAEADVFRIGDAVHSEGGSRTGMLPGTDPDRLAYVMYTSGSTGRPKGVAVTHRDITGLVTDTRWTDEDLARVALHSPLAFDASVFEVWTPLSRGGTVVVVPPAPVDGAALSRTLIDARVTTVFLTTALFNLMVQEHPEALASVRQVWAGGETASPTAFAKATEVVGGGTVVHVYGPTETTTFALCHTVGEVDGPSVPLGGAMDGVRAYLVDTFGQLAGFGMVGELCLGGSGLARGYVGMPGLTAERFVPDPYGPPGSRMYRTGDLFRLRADGLLEFLGRVDRQVKIRGFRIEPGEIESVLTGCADVGQTVVIARDDRSVGKTLVAYIVPADGADGADEDVESLRERVREFLRGRVPDYMVPTAIVVLETFPLTTNGKIDLRRLPEPVVDTGARGPRTTAERVLCSLFAETLALDTVGIDDDFFRSGGHSVLAVHLIGRLRTEYKIDLAIKQLFRASTVADLAVELGASGEAALATGKGDPSQDGTTIPVTTCPDVGAPLSFAQQRLWFLDQMWPGRPDYNVPVARWLSGSLDTSRLRGAISALVRRHDILRTRYEMDDDGPYQIVDPTAEPDLRVVDCSDGAQGRARRSAEHVLNEEALRPFELNSAPVARFLLIRLADDEHILLLVVHHIATDGWSNELLWQDLASLYNDGDTAVLTAPPLRYADYARWQHEQQETARLRRDVDYWRERLAGFEPVELPTDRERPPFQSGRGAEIRFQAGRELRSRVLRVGTRYGTTAFMTLFTAFEILVAKLTGRRDIGIGVPVAARDRPELESLVGFLANTVVIRSDIDPECGFGELLAKTKNDAAEAYSHGELPFDRVIGELRTPRDPSRNPLFQLMFGTTESTLSGAREQWPGLRAREHPVPFSAAKFDLALGIADHSDRLVGQACYATDLFDRTTVERFLRRYLSLLENLCEKPDDPVGTLDLTDEHMDTTAEFVQPSSVIPVSP
ncbi:amino acid adenylation domain-containing protein [Saccharomonospora halophila]|uniref:amino acid adenylation domain-containing protein n=1 Tax=Saccharomonospora halophila TaxID=129922 RepID=UPI00038122FC|nr:non-ribosomal peptide synthetase [Saccharomonospora halophila]